MTCRNRKLKVGTRRVGTNARNRWNSALSEAPWQLITNQRAAARIESSTAAAVAAARLTVQLDRELVRVAGLVGVPDDPLPVDLRPGAINAWRPGKKAADARPGGAPPKRNAGRIVWEAVRIVFGKIGLAGKNPRKNLRSVGGVGSGLGPSFGDRILAAGKRGRR